MELYKEDRENVFHKRVNTLKNKGYRGFTLSGISKEWDGLRVMARNDKGLIISASGDTKEEAFGNVIDNIDQVYDELYQETETISGR